MTNTVIQLTTSVDEEFVLRRFRDFRGRYASLWTCRATTEEDWKYVLEDWLSELKKFRLECVRKAFEKCMTTFKDYPPTLPQLIDLCIKESSIPQIDEVIRKMTARDFSHPIVKMVYDRIGSWNFKTSTAEKILEKTRQYYPDCLSEFYSEPKKSWTMLESFNAKPKALPEPEKIPSTKERRGFKERLNECQKRLEEEKLRCGGRTYREFDEKKINPRNADFDKAVYEEFRDYLLSIPEKDTIILPPRYAYQRMRFLAEKERPELLRRAGFVRPCDREADSSLKTSDKKSGPQKPFNSWND